MGDTRTTAATGEPPTDFSKATPRPWVCSESQPGIWHIDREQDAKFACGLIATTWSSFDAGDAMSGANAALIVAAVNERGALHDLLADLLAFAKDAPPEMLKRAADLLAGIEGGRP